jgi:hypothetical protein
LALAALADEIKPWVLIEEIVAASDATIDFEALDASLYDRFMIKVENAHPSSDNVQVRLRVGTGGTPTYQTTNQYHSCVEYGEQGDTDDIYTRDNDPAADFIEITKSVGLGNDTPQALDARVEFVSPDDGYNTKFTTEGVWNGTSDEFAWAKTRGGFNSTVDVTAIRFYLSGGTFQSGSFKLYGIRK